MQPTDQVLQEEFEGLWQAEHGLAVNDEGGHFLVTIVDQLALVGRGIGRRDRRRTVAVVRRPVVMVTAVAVAVTVAVAVAVSRNVQTRMSVQTLSKERALGALQIGGGGSCGGGGGRMAQVKTRMVGVIGNSGQTGQRNRNTGYAGTHAGQEAGLTVQRQGALVGRGGCSGGVQGRERHGRGHGDAVQAGTHTGSGHTLKTGDVVAVTLPFAFAFVIAHLVAARTGRAAHRRTGRAVRPLVGERNGRFLEIVSRTGRSGVVAVRWRAAFGTRCDRTTGRRGGRGH